MTANTLATHEYRIVTTLPLWLLEAVDAALLLIARLSGHVIIIARVSEETAE